MPKDEADPADPMELVGVELPAASDAELTEMTDCFIEEFARMGWSRAKVLKLFRTPFYAAAHRVWLAKGERFVTDRIARLAFFFSESEVEGEGRKGAHAQSA
ncbi:MAG: hypothetical protein HY608_04965 [Planctomycetes bacterium]|nr:hypothetical protein [Planctomycetota bacterium]